MRERSFRPFQDMPIRFKLLFGYLAVFFLAIGIGSIFLYSSIRSTLEKNIEKELQTCTQLILSMVKTSADASVKNHLRAIAETSSVMVQHYWGQYLNNVLTEAEAKEKAAQTLLSHQIGMTGYIYVVNSNGIIKVHPEQELIGTNQSSHVHVKKQIQMRNGYLEYDWSNPSEDKVRPKALSMAYFAPWDWIISATSYRNEFNMLFSVEDLRASLLSIRFGPTGYPYIIDTDGLVIIHPNLEGSNVYDRRDSNGRLMFQEIINSKNGQMTYYWQNPDETKPRKKIVYYNYVDELDWIVASSGYYEELYGPLDVAQTAIMLIMGAMLILIIPFTWWFGSSITQPLGRIMCHFAKGIEDEQTERVDLSGQDEIGQLATYYNQFMEKLQKSRQELERSEREYRSVYENSWEGIIMVTTEGEFLSCNSSMATILGYDSPEQLMDEVSNVIEFYLIPEVRSEYLAMVNDKGVVRGLEVQFVRRDGQPLWVSLNSRKITDYDDNFVKLETFVTDISRQKEYDEAQKKAQEELERRVATRTAELSYRVSELKSLNAQGDQLREMGEHLQVCRETAETFPVIRLYMQRLFYRDVVSLFLCDEGREMMDLVMTTEPAPDLDMSFPRDDCWALRKGKQHFADASDSSLACPHWDKTGSDGGSLCVPLVAQDEQVGMLQLVVGNTDLVTADGRSAILLGEKGRLAAIVAEHLALALTNIKLRETLRLQSIEDPLTGLYNRRYMLEFMQREMARISRNESTTSIVMLDVDHFKRFNDEHGHEVGDEVLRKLAAFLKGNIRSTDLACRFGGEEFVLVMVDTPLDQCEEKAEKLREGIEKSVAIYSGETRLGVTVSMGVACTKEKDVTFEEVLQAADAALYEAKENGRNRVEVAFSSCPKAQQ